ncbi:hypothetical protein V8G54_024825 [Vigna mungo]|uniref:Uncharacterized protein n=1 Tax=Vigna mungo TaxID=3915 RepID=A0AAQ3N6L2_VIGMU
MVESDPSTPIATIIASIKTSMGYTTSYRKVWLAKQHAIEHVYGNWEESFNKLPFLLQAMQTFLPGFVYKLKTQPITDGQEIRQNQQYFKRLFWTFKPCVDGFPYCKPLVQVDRTFPGKVEGETTDAWFIQQTNQWVTKGQCVHVYCIRHIAQNFTRRFRDTSLKKDLVNMAAAWIDQIPRQQFTLAYDEGRRWGHLTTNLTEAINSVLKKTRNLPISSIVLAIYTRCNSLFTERGKQITAMISVGHVYSENATKVLQDADSKSNTHKVVEFDRNTTRFRVEEMENLLSDWMNDGMIVASFKRFIYHCIIICLGNYNMKNIGHHTKAQIFGLIQQQKGMQRVDQNHPESALKWTSGNKHTHEIAHTVKLLATQEIIYTWSVGCERREKGDISDASFSAEDVDLGEKIFVYSMALNAGWMGCLVALGSEEGDLMKWELVCREIFRLVDGTTLKYFFFLSLIAMKKSFEYEMGVCVRCLGKRIKHVIRYLEVTVKKAFKPIPFSIACKFNLLERVQASHAILKMVVGSGDSTWRMSKKGHDQAVVGGALVEATNFGL